MDSEFYAAVIPEPTTILGVRLRPLSLGHLVILHRLKSSFVTPDEPFTIHDLALSVLVCSLSYKDGLSLFDAADTDRLFATWFRKLTRPGWFGLFRKPVQIDYAKKAGEFGAYIKRHCQIPHYEYEPANKMQMECPDVQVIRVELMQSFKLSDDEIMDRSWALCLWDYVTLKAKSGQVKMTDRQAIAEAQRIAQQVAEKLKARGE